MFRGDRTMTVVFEQVLMLVLFAAAGYVLCKKHLSDSKHTKLLSTLEIYVFLPGTVFNTFSKNFTAAYLREKYVLVLISAAVLLIVAVSMQFFSKLLTKDSYRRSVYSYSLTIPNYGYMGYALAGSLFGSETLLNVMIYALPLSMYVYTIGYCILTKTKLNLKKLLNPVLISMAIGMIVGLAGWQPPALVGTMAEKAAACMAPVSMLLTGMVISEYRFSDLLRKKMNYVVSALRLLALPCLIAGALRLLRLELAVIPALMIFCMPCGLNTVVFPRMIGEDCETGASLAVISSLASCATIPFCVWLFTH